MKKIILNKKFITLVDDEDYEWLSQWKWFAYKARNTYYVSRHSEDGKRVDMHREILGLKRGDGKLGDHKDRNGLNNQRYNLRIATRELNGFNCKMKSNNTSGFRGVNWSKGNKMWEAKLKISGRRIRCGYFHDRIQAALAYDRVALQYRGKAAVLNFPQENR